MVRLLSKDAFSATMQGNTTNITKDYVAPAVLWTYVSELAEQNIVKHEIVLEKNIQVVYRNEDNSFHHIMLPLPNPDKFVVVILNTSSQIIEGHFILSVL